MNNRTYALLYFAAGFFVACALTAVSSGAYALGVAEFVVAALAIWCGRRVERLEKQG